MQDLTKRHEAAFAEIKAYYNDVTANNLDLVKALKEDAAELRCREAATDKLLAEMAAENRQLAEPLAQVCSTGPCFRGVPLEVCCPSWVKALKGDAPSCAAAKALPTCSWPRLPLRTEAVLPCIYLLA